MKHQALLRKAVTRCSAWALGAAVLSAAAFALTAMPAQAQVSIGVSITVGSPPPPLPVYEQPPIPAVGYIWTPGYWAWDSDEEQYYWVPGTWVLAPFTGALWTPAYWGWGNGVYGFHQGYWGTEVGFYGGINYGYGYGGEGYEGGHWDRGGFYYNRTVNNIRNVNITNVYNKTVINNVTVNRISYNGGNGGVQAQPTARQMAFAREQHTAPVAAQQQHIAMARQDPAMRVSNNHGVPTIAATARPAAFNGPEVVHAHNAPVPAAESPRPGVEGPRAQPTEHQPLRSSGFAPHPNANPNEAPAREPSRPFNRPENAPENAGAPSTYHPETAPMPRREEAVPRQEPAYRPAPPPREVAPREMAPERVQPVAPREPVYHAPPPQEYHPAAPRPAPSERAPAERPHPAPQENRKKPEEQHPPGGG